MSFPSDDINFADDSPLSAKGRFSRLAYAAWSMLNNLIFSIIAALIILVFLRNQSPVITLSILICIFLVSFYYHFIFAIRRLHDFNASGWWSLLYLIPIVNLFFVLILLCKKGDQDMNDFGPIRFTLFWEKILGWIYIISLPINYYLFSSSLYQFYSYSYSYY